MTLQVPGIFAGARSPRGPANRGKIGRENGRGPYKVNGCGARDEGPGDGSEFAFDVPPGVRVEQTEGGLLDDR